MAALNQDDYQKITKAELIQNYEDIKSCNVPVWRINIDKEQVTIPIDKLEYYLGDENKEESIFYIAKNWRDQIKEFKEKKVIEKNESKPAQQTATMKEAEKYGRVAEQVEKFKLMTIVEREEILDGCIENLTGMEGKNAQIDIDAVLKMVDVVANTFYANHSNLENSLEMPNLKGNFMGIYAKSEWAIQILIKIFSKKNLYSYKDFNITDQISTGSYTIDHMTKVLLKFIIFCLFYNDYIAEGLINRGEFKDKYLRYYKRKMPSVENLTVEIVFKDGLRRIDVDKELKVYAVGALLYDIGKLMEINYHDGSDPYNEGLVKKHVLNGFNMIIKARGYPFTVAAMAAFHHEYYYGQGGYKFTNPIISKLTQKKRSDDNAKFFITFNENEFREGIAIAFFPCKILEIIDIYDALITRRRKTNFEALNIMKKEFIAKNLKIDPILYDIFVEYLTRCSLVTATERKEIDSILY